MISTNSHSSLKIMHAPRTLSSKLSLGIVLLAIPIFVLALGILFVQSRNNIKKEATEHAQSLLNTTMQRVSRYLMAVETATNINAWEAVDNPSPDSLLALTHRIVKLNPHVSGCSISTEPYFFSNIGRYFSAYSIRKDKASPQSTLLSSDSIITVIEEEYEYFEKIWYKTPLTLNEPCWVNYYDETDSLELTLEGMIASYGKPLYDNHRRLIGIISTDISLLHLSHVITSEKPYPNSYFMMLGPDGHYIIHPDTTQLFTHTIFETPALNTLGREMASGEQGTISLNIDGKPSLVCFQPVPGTPWSLALVCPESDILRSYHRLVIIILPLLFAGLLVILVFAKQAVAHALAPLNQLLTKTQSIAAGNYEVYIPRSDRLDAVGQLQNNFANMLQSLNFHMVSIRYTAGQAKHRNAELAQATKLAKEAVQQKTVFIQNVTHQIRTPLNIVMGFTQVLRDYTADITQPSLSDEETKNITQTMKHNAQTLNRLVQMLYDSSALGINDELNSHQIDNVSCNDVAKEAMSYVKLNYPELNVSFNSSVPSDLCIKTNQLYLMRSLRELLYNAAKYSDGQRVAISVSATESAVTFTVEDTGKGISEADHDLIFEPFTKVDDLTEGLGLGLPLAKRHINNLGGNISLDTEYHDGCRFIVTLPRS